MVQCPVHVPEPHPIVSHMRSRQCGAVHNCYVNPASPNAYACVTRSTQLVDQL